MNPVTFSHHRSLLIALLCTALAMFACAIPGQPGGLSSNTGNLLPQPSAGLAGLLSYHAVYDLTIQGTIDGKSIDRQSLMEYSFVTASKDEEVVWQEQEAGSLTTFLHSIRVGNTVYTQSQDGQECWGEVENQPTEAVPQPASLLLPVTHASQVGPETVDGIAAQHFHFDQTGLSSAEAGASGDMWIAQQGGYVVKYVLSIPAPATPTGQGVEIAETLSYEMNGINSLNQIPLPAGCVPVLVDIPAMADAQDVHRGSGYMEYTSASTPAQVIDFYKQALPPLGWTQAESAQPSAQTGLQALEYSQGDQNLVIFLDNSAGSLVVTVVLSTPAPAAQEPTVTPGPSPTPPPIPTVNPSQSGLPSNVPLYPGATNLVKLPSAGVSFTTSDPPDAVAKFYRDQLPALKWTLQNEMKPAANTYIQNWEQANQILVVNVVVNNGVTTVLLLLHNQ